MSRLLNNYIKKKDIKGYFLQIKGRFQKSTRKIKFLKRNGFVSFNNLKCKLDVEYDVLYTKFGATGLKIILSH